MKLGAAQATPEPRLLLARRRVGPSSALHDRLEQVVQTHFTFEHYVDDNMRNISDHYHAHARPVGGFFGHGLKRR